MMIRHYPFGAVESSPAISSNRVAKSAEGVTYYGLSEADGKGLIGILALADKMMKLKQVEGGEQVIHGEKSTFIGIEIVKEGGFPTDLSALAESALSEGVGILIEQVGGESFRIYKTRNVLLAGEVTSRVPNSAVAIEPAKGWVKPEFWNKNKITIAVAVAGLSAVAIGGYYFMARKKPMRANREAQSERLLRASKLAWLATHLAQRRGAKETLVERERKHNAAMRAHVKAANIALREGFEKMFHKHAMRASWHAEQSQNAYVARFSKRSS